MFKRIGTREIFILCSLWSILYLLSFVFCPLSSVLAADNPNLYIIENITIEIPNTGKNRDQALAKAHQEALQQLFAKLLSSEDQNIRGQIDQQTLNTWVQQVGIEDETTTPKSYRARFRIGFNRPLVDQFLAERGLVTSNPASNPTMSFLIIPLFQESLEAEPIIWSDNPWHVAWSNLPLQTTVTPITIPLGDIEDIRDLNTDQVLNLEKPAFDRIGQRYKTGDSLILAAQLDSQNQLHIAASRLGIIDHPKFYEKVFPVNPQSLSQDLSKIVKTVANDLDTLLSQEKLAESDQSTLEAEIYVPINTLAEWQDIQNRLKKNPVVRQYDVLAINRTAITINMKTKADLPTLKETLKNSGLKLDQAEQGWILRLDPPQPLLQKPTSTMPPNGFLQIP